MAGETDQNLTPLERDVQYEITKEAFSLTPTERLTLLYYLGYLRGSSQDGGRNTAPKDIQTAHNYIRQTLYRPKDFEGTTLKDRVFRFKGSSPDIDLKDYALRPTVTDSSEKETVRFLSYAGLSMNEKEQISVIRAMTTFLKVFDTDLHANRFKNLSIFGVGKVREGPICHGGTLH